MIKIYEQIKDFQIANKIDFKMNPYKIIKQNNWKALSYEEFGKDLIGLMKISKDGFSVLNDGNYYIFYNPFSGNSGRLNFTLSHEIGHIVLEHHKTTDRKILMYGENNYLENQANIVARNILMPAKTTSELLEVKSIKELAEIFEVSPEMAAVRVNQLKTDLYYLNLVSKAI